MKARFNKSRLWMISILAVIVFATMGLFTGCDGDKDKNGVDDRTESEGTYYISVPGYEAQHSEAIFISNVQDEDTGDVGGSIYSPTSNTTYYFYTQEVAIREFEGNIWYGCVKCTDGANRRIYFRRTGLGSYVGTGSVTIGAEVLGSGGSVGGSWSYSVYNEYGRITYCIYDGLTYAK